MVIITIKTIFNFFISFSLWNINKAITMIFILTSSGARTNICSDMLLLNKEDFLKKTHDVNCDIRFANIGDYTCNIKQMSLEEFESVFTIGEIESIPKKFALKYFKNEIKEKYYLQKLSTTVPEKGKIYIDSRNGKYLFLGKGNYYYNEKINPIRDLVKTEHYCYLFIIGEIDEKLFESEIIRSPTSSIKMIVTFEVSKTPKKLFDTDQPKINIPKKTYIIETKEYTETINLL